MMCVLLWLYKLFFDNKVVVNKSTLVTLSIARLLHRLWQPSTTTMGNASSNLVFLSSPCSDYEEERWSSSHSLVSHCRCWGVCVCMYVYGYIYSIYNYKRSQNTVDCRSKHQKQGHSVFVFCWCTVCMYVRMSPIFLLPTKKLNLGDMSLYYIASSRYSCTWEKIKYR